MKKRSIIFLSITVVMLVGVGNLVFGQGDVLSSYRSYQDIVIPKINVPTVVELPIFNVNFERFDFLVYNKTNKIFEPSFLIKQLEGSKLEVYWSDTFSKERMYEDKNTLDSDDSTYLELSVDGANLGQATIVITSNEDINTDTLFLLLDNYVALPKTISIQSHDSSGWKTVLATKAVESQTVYFPKTKTRKLVIELTYSQPLRITELRFNNSVNKAPNHSLRFLAQPGNDYSVYFNPDRRVSTLVGEMANLSDNRDVLRLSSSVTKENPTYVIADTDGDKIPDVRDNCVSISNTDQADVNQNGRGDVCDDFDKDGVVNSLDNCRDLPNVSQIDTDGDKIGDVCDSSESRLTEKYKWLPWLGIVAAAVVVAGLFVLTAISMRKKEDLPPQN